MSWPPQSLNSFLAMAWLSLDPANYAKCASQHRQDAGTTTKPWMKCKGEIHSRYLTTWGIFATACGQRHASRDTGTVELGPCLARKRRKILNLLLLPVDIRDFHTRTFPLCFALSHSRAGISRMLEKMPLSLSQACVT